MTRVPSLPLALLAGEQLRRQEALESTWLWTDDECAAFVRYGSPWAPPGLRVVWEGPRQGYGIVGSIGLVNPGRALAGAAVSPA